jgi:transposase-like protein
MFKSMISIDETICRLYEFLLLHFPTDEDCLNELIRLFIGALKCNECGSNDLDRIGNNRFAKCRRCRKTTWLTARTFLAGIKKPRAYLLQIILIGNGIAISASGLARIVGIASSSAQCIVKKIDAAVQSVMGTGGIQVDCRHFFQCISKRSTHTPAKEHPLAELAEAGNAAQCLSKSGKSLNANTMPKLSADEELVYKLLSEAPITIDMLAEKSGLPINNVSAVLTILELGGLTKMCPGNNFIKCQPPGKPAPKLSKKAKRFVDASVELIRQTYKGVSRKYLQNHLAFCWSIKDRSRWSVKALVKACAKFGPITDAEVNSYVSPPVVLLFPVL